MKKQLALLAIASVCTPLLAATIPFTNATQCSCSLKHKNDHFLTCSIQPNQLDVYIGNIINKNNFAPTQMLAPGQSGNAPITTDDQGPAVAYNSDGSADYYQSADLSDFHTPSALTLVHLFNATSAIDYPVESRCINTQTCTYLKSIPGCLHSDIARTQ